jgi:predicted transcriptional regulator
VRLNDEQRRRVRLAAVQLERSQQSLISEAIDEFLDQLCERELPHCHCLKKR